MAFLKNGQDDYAIIVGLQTYPGLDDPQNGNAPLSGPENDANAFYEWVTSASGGNLLPQNVTRILSSDYPRPASDRDYCSALPASTNLIKEFEKLRTLSLDKQKKQLGSTIGRRLYIFMSGHGIAPITFGNKLEKEAALLMCNVPPDNKGADHYHIPGSYTANWFGENECFEEVFLFMDCCRDRVIVNAINMFFPHRGNRVDTTRFYALSTLETRRSREKMIDGQMRGIFTKTLLDGLNGGAAVVDPGGTVKTQITGKSLKGFLFNNINKYVDPQYQEPDIDHFPQRNEGEDILIKDFGISQVPTFPVNVILPENTTGTIEILDGDAETVIASTIIQRPLAIVTFNIPRGKYLLKGTTANNEVKEIFFQVLGTENVTTEVSLLTP